MRILHINCNYIGNGLHQLMVERLDKLGNENRVFVPLRYKAQFRIQPKEDVCVCRCFGEWDKLVFDYKQHKIQKALQENLNVGDYDLIHAYTLFTDGNCARKMSKKYGIPYVVAVRNTDVNDFLRLMPHLRKRGVQTMLDAQAVFFLSEGYRKQVFEKYVPRKYWAAIEAKTHLIPNGIDDFWFEHTPETENELKKPVKLLFAGRIDRNKNVPTIQKAIQILQDRGREISLTVVGRVEDKKELQIIQSDPYTQYLPPVPKEELVSLYREHNIFVMPSFTESFGLVYAEAMSQGLPVIYSKGQGFDGQFPEGQVGYRVDAYDARDVADGIEELIRSFDRVKTNVGEAARRFNWTEISAIYDAIYKTIK